MRDLTLENIIKKKNQLNWYQGNIGKQIQLYRRNRNELQVKLRILEISKFQNVQARFTKFGKSHSTRHISNILSTVDQQKEEESPPSEKEEEKVYAEVDNEKMKEESGSGATPK